MSYPLSLQALVVEDQEGPRQAYENFFETIADELEGLPFRPAHPCFAFSHQEAVEYLNGSKIFHVVILDLHLPDKPKMPQSEGIELGLDLLSRFSDRDLFPVPCLLVISGQVGSTEQGRLQDKLRQGFHYGRVLAKGTDYGMLENEIRSACREAIRYCSVGTHLRDARHERYPTITPREEDLLRRSVLQQHGAVGLDLNWWSARRFSDGVKDSSGASGNTWTKVLMGRYLLKEGEGASRPKFFKLFPGLDAQYVVESAHQLEQKLSHIKLTSTVSSTSTALLVTEKVGAQDERPESLETFLRRATPEQAADVARQICGQIRQLGDHLPTSRATKTILCEWLSLPTIAEQWKRFGDEIQQVLRSNTDPTQLYSELSRCEEKVRLNEQSLVHGDLHLANVALDHVDGKALAYIFDSGMMRRNVAGRDLAVLETSLVLHQSLNLEAVIEVCAALYPIPSDTEENRHGVVHDPVGKNTVEFVRALRKQAEASNEIATYALMVFDTALIQVAGLAFGPTGNMINNQWAAVYFLGRVAEWYKAIRATNTLP